LEKNIGDFFVINLSCPNAFGGQPFSDPEKLDLLLAKIRELPRKKPIFLKMSPDLNQMDVDGIIELAKKYSLDGFVCSNLTKDFSNVLVKEKIKDNLPLDLGGLSGKPLEELSNVMISYIYKKTQGAFLIIGCGGIFSAEDAYKKIRLGASLVELITGMIYKGPQVISEINQGVAKFLKKDGFQNIAEAVGVDNLVY
jgi:dihydroorotate dehydrogenase